MTMMMIAKPSSRPLQVSVQRRRAAVVVRLSTKVAKVLQRQYHQDSSRYDRSNLEVIVANSLHEGLQFLLWVEVWDEVVQVGGGSRHWRPLRPLWSKRPVWSPK